MQGARDHYLARPEITRGAYREKEELLARLGRRRGDGGAGSGTSSQLYISRLAVTPGTTVADGQLLAEIDGEPMFVLAGAVPAWRILSPGESGPDVAELQKALAALGYGDGGDTSGYFGAGTQDAVSAFYQYLGYTAPTTGPVT
jgi:HlyD family secretion protein